MGNCACFQGLPGRSPLKERARASPQKHAGAQEVAITTEDLILLAGYKHKEDPKPADKVSTGETEAPARMSTDESKPVDIKPVANLSTEGVEPAAVMSADGSKPADEQNDESKLAEGESNYQLDVGQISESKPAEEQQNLEAELAKQVRTGDAKLEGVSSYMWMWGDCNPIAAFNPARWSGYQIAEDMIHDLRWQESKNLHRPIKIKDHEGGSWNFKTAEQGISALKAAVETGGLLRALGQPREDHYKKPKSEEEETSRAEVDDNVETRSEPKEEAEMVNRAEVGEDVETRSEPKEEAELVNAAEVDEDMETGSEPTEEAELEEQMPTEKDRFASETSKFAIAYMWMWGDCNPVATFNPKRWSEYQSAESMLQDLHNQKSLDLSRPIKIKDSTVGDWRFDSVEDAILALIQAVESGGQLCSQSQIAEVVKVV